MNNPRENFSQIYDQCVDKIYRFIFLKVSSQEIAEDLCSETFLKGWQSFKDNNKEIKNPQAFLYQIARNLIVDHYREKGRTQIVSADCVPITDPKIALEENALLESDLNEIKAVLVNLKEEYQEVVIWRYIEDLTIPEIAKMLDKKEGTVRVLLHRALKSLKKEVENKREYI